MLKTLHTRRTPAWFDGLPHDRLLIETSLWSADLARLEDDIRRVEAGTDLFHIDVADGHLAPALLFFPDLVARLRSITDRPFHVHLMARDTILLEQIRQFAAAGADLISIHAENGNLAEGLDLITSLGKAAGVVLQLQTPVAAVESYLDQLDMITLLGTLMGIKGAGLDAGAPDRLRQARELAARAPHRIIVAADGGIREHTVPGLRKAGAESVVMGSLAFGAPDFRQRVAWARALPSWV
jgi:ribulose-phosphate 3-epimerase